MAPAIKSVLQQAAQLREVNLSEFMIESSQAAAEMALADRTRFVLAPRKWQEFNAALDSPPKSIPALRRLLSETGIFEKRA